MRTGLVSDPLFLRHDPGAGHPERPERLDAVLAALAGLPLVPVAARDASLDELATIHDPAYLHMLEERVRAGLRSLDPDTWVCPASWAAARRAAGAALALGEALLEDRIEAGFAAVRPPGHHAGRARAMGFCLLNNAALLARFLARHERQVCIVDWDVHHGNGTVDILAGDPAIAYCSLHQSPFYPGTGLRSEAGVRNLPLPAGTDDDAYRHVFEMEVLPWVEDLDPDVIVVSAGFDGLASDPLAGFDLTPALFGELTRLLAARPILSVLEGGYDLDGLARAARHHVDALLAG